MKNAPGKLTIALFILGLAGCATYPPKYPLTARAQAVQIVPSTSTFLGGCKLMGPVEAKAPSSTLVTETV